MVNTEYFLLIIFGEFSKKLIMYVIHKYYQQKNKTYNDDQ